ncbi:hypothetical protein [Flavobacterium beibuense]|uniref:Uncharacterized protein n=1 Tax=Flavobacterium beibuense TaxID=657326 RepID=A0A444WEP8_9FLAO|nr:hypothetical protein [Flavobacterium beibuense]RYJ44289.1 hypothetical protein NU09_0899 [Flavobacterium beibuense]
MESNSDSIYEVLVKLLGIKFKAQYNNSNIIFERFLQIKDMTTDQIHFALILDSQKFIKFRNRNEFIENFIVYLEAELKELDNQFEELQKNAREERWVDENALFLQHEEIGYNGKKLNSMIKKFKSLQKQV